MEQNSTPVNCTRVNWSIKIDPYEVCTGIPGKEMDTVIMRDRYHFEGDVTGPGCMDFINDLIRLSETHHAKESDESDDYYANRNQEFSAKVVIVCLIFSLGFLAAVGLVRLLLSM